MLTSTCVIGKEFFQSVDRKGVLQNFEREQEG